MAWTQTLFAIGLCGAPELELHWEAGEGCPSGEDVAARVGVLLGRTLDARTDDGSMMEPEGEQAPPSAVVARGVIRREAGQRFVLTLTIRTAAGERERSFPGQTCDVLADTAALVIAAAVDEQPEPAPAPTPPPDVAPEPPPTPAPPVAPPPEAPSNVAPPRHRVEGAVRAGAGGLFGPLPGPSAGVDAAAALLVERARIELGFSYWFPRRAETPDGASGGEIQLWTLGVRGCWVPGVKIVEFPLCGGVQAGPMRGDGFGLGAPTSTRLPWVAFDAGAALAVVPWPFFGVWLGADLLVPVTRPGFAIDDLGLVHRARPVGGAVVLGIEGRIGPGPREHAR